MIDIKLQRALTENRYTIIAFIIILCILSSAFIYIGPRFNFHDTIITAIVYLVIICVLKMSTTTSEERLSNIKIYKNYIKLINKKNGKTKRIITIKKDNIREFSVTFSRDKHIYINELYCHISLKLFEYEYTKNGKNKVPKTFSFFCSKGALKEFMKAYYYIPNFKLHYEPLCKNLKDKIIEKYIKNRKKYTIKLKEKYTPNINFVVISEIFFLVYILTIYTNSLENESYKNFPLITLIFLIFGCCFIGMYKLFSNLTNNQHDLCIKDNEMLFISKNKNIITSIETIQLSNTAEINITANQSSNKTEIDYVFQIITKDLKNKTLEFKNIKFNSIYKIIDFAKYFYNSNFKISFSDKTKLPLVRFYASYEKKPLLLFKKIKTMKKKMFRHFFQTYTK